MKMIDVAGLTLREARIALHEAGNQIASVRVTAPPKWKSDLFEEDYRVIRQNLLDDGQVELLVCKPL